jgi:hypothetical protein
MVRIDSNISADVTEDSIEKQLERHLFLLSLRQFGSYFGAF